MAKVNRVGSAFSSLPFDGIDNVANVFIHEDFLGTLDVADGDGFVAVRTAVGNWTIEESVGDSAPTTAAVAGVAGHPGILRIGTGQTTAAAGDVAALSLGATVDPGADGDILLDSNGVYVAAILRIPDIDATNVEFGLVGQVPAAPNSSAADVVSFVYEEADFGAGTWAAQVNSATVDVEEEFTLTYVQGDWVLLELSATSSGAIFRLTTEDGQETIQLTPAAMPIVALQPVLAIESVGAAEELVDVDAIHLRYGRPHQSARKVGGIDWLGQ
jgi:hypothetical protein